jgi:hypothetical protein
MTAPWEVPADIHAQVRRDAEHALACADFSPPVSGRFELGYETWTLAHRNLELEGFTDVIIDPGTGHIHRAAWEVVELRGDPTDGLTIAWRVD